MIGLDTNVLVRLLIADNPAQTEAARRFVHARCTEASPGFIGNVALVELIWVLEAAYGYRRKQVAETLDALLTGPDREFESPDEVRAALDDYRSGEADFADCLIGRINRAHGCEATATFDKKAAKLEGFIAVK